jgi:predicted RNA-binding Zn-ribbon protein involved in translation (DUF1610 family)
MCIYGLPDGRGHVMKAPVCDRCDIPMRLTAIIPSMLPDRHDDFQYRCPACGAEATRRQNRSD